tara:strand:+ start:16267 stop:17592 length:1326 start_codon:yes stop_codon:yes gene_type:complete
MEILRKDRDKLNSVLTIKINKLDYEENIDKVLLDYKKRANIPGFRKGHTPFGLIKKQYGLSVKVDEINKLLQKTLSEYIVKEKLQILGNPIPVKNPNMDMSSEELSFNFELGLSPNFIVSLNNKKPIDFFKIEADKKMIDSQISNIQTQYGKLISKNSIENGFEINGSFNNKEFDVDNSTSFKLKNIKGKSNKDLIKKMKVGDLVKFKTKNLFDKDSDLSFHLKLNEKNKGTMSEVDFTLNEINERVPADLDQELFDKLFGKGIIKSVTELRTKLKEDAEKNFSNQSDQKFLNDVTEFLISNTKFDLPADFLKKWMQTAGDKNLTVEESQIEFEKSEKGLRYQLIESKIIEENKLKIDSDQIKKFSKEVILMQMKQYGQMNPGDKELESISNRLMSNKDEVKRISDQLLSQKLIKLFKSEMKLKTISVNYEKFIEMAYSKK